MLIKPMETAANLLRNCRQQLPRARTPHAIVVVSHPRFNADVETYYVEA